MEKTCKDCEHYRPPENPKFKVKCADRPKLGVDGKGHYYETTACNLSLIHI